MSSLYSFVTTWMLVLQFWTVLRCSMYQKSNPFLFSQMAFRLSILSVASLRFSTFFMGWGCRPHAQPPTWRTRISLFVWVITFDLSCMGGPNSCCATTSIALRILWSLKPHHYVNLTIPSGGGGVGVIIHRTFGFFISLDPLQILPAPVAYSFFILHSMCFPWYIAVPSDNHWFFRRETSGGICRLPQQHQEDGTHSWGLQVQTVLMTSSPVTKSIVSLSETL